MKNKALIRLLIFCLPLVGYSQFDFNKYESATIHFHDGTSLKGLAKIVQEYKIKFKLGRGEKSDIWTDLMLKGITFHYENENVEMVYFYTDIDYPRLGYIVEEGYVTLYSEVHVVKGSNSFRDSNGYLISVQPTEYEYTYYFVKRQGDKLAISLTNNAKSLNKRFLGIDFSTKGFKETANEFFHDCKGVLKRLDSNEFNVNTIPEMVYYYNDHCAD